jgi:hypothetical protein
MPRPDATAEFIAAIESGMVRPALFVEANFTSGPIYVWSGRGTVTWNGNDWLGAGSLISVSTVEEGSTVEARGTTISMSGIDVTLLTGILTEFQVGLPVTVWLGLFDEASTLIPNPVISFAGRMDQPTIDVGGTTATISINCESRLLDMNVSVERRYTKLADGTARVPSAASLHRIPIWLVRLLPQCLRCRRGHHRH